MGALNEKRCKINITKHFGLREGVVVEPGIRRDLKKLSKLQLILFA
jgi:hypothetical protein